MRLAIVGLGLIGGSIARAVHEPSSDGERWFVSAWSPSGRGALAAASAAVIDRSPATLAEALEGADLVVLAAPPLACLDLLDTIAETGLIDVAPDIVLTDVASTKAAIVERAAALGLPFVGGHPMAGSERSGFEAASADLFVDRPWVLTPVPGSADGPIERVEALALRCGGRPVRMGAAAHDRAVAAISHLPLLLSVALVETVERLPDRDAALALAASGWRDASRLARGDPDMATGIAVTNHEALAELAREVGAVLERWVADLEREPAPDAATLRAAFAAARDAVRLD